MCQPLLQVFPEMCYLIITSCYKPGHCHTETTELLSVTFLKVKGVGLGCSKARVIILTDMNLSNIIQALVLVFVQGHLKKN